MEDGDLIQQKLMIRILLEALGGDDGTFQAHPTILLLNGEDFGPEVQEQRTHMPIKNFLKTTFLCQNFLKKRADYPL